MVDLPAGEPLMMHPPRYTHASLLCLLQWLSSRRFLWFPVVACLLLPREEMGRPSCECLQSGINSIEKLEIPANLVLVFHTNTHQLISWILIEKILLILEVSGYEVPFPRFLLGLGTYCSSEPLGCCRKTKKNHSYQVFTHTNTLRCACSFGPPITVPVSAMCRFVFAKW